MKRHIPFALVYDFDGTLAPGNMQERDFIPSLGMTTASFWDEVSRQSKAHQADSILIYMKLMLDKARDASVPVRREDFAALGKHLVFFNGVLPYEDGPRAHPGWFERINAYGRAHGVAVEHYIISSGIREMIAGSPIAKWFTAIFASSFYYDHNGAATWPALAINYTNKTQYLFRINKGALDVSDHSRINKFISKEERPVPFEQIVFVGDGDTDIPCFRLMNNQGGYAIAVYRPKTKGAYKKASTLRKEGRVNYVAAADYRDGEHLDGLVKGIIDKIASDQALKRLGSK